MLSAEGFSISPEASIAVVLFRCKVVLRSRVFSFVVGCKGGCGRNYYHSAGCPLPTPPSLSVVEWGSRLLLPSATTKLITRLILTPRLWLRVSRVAFGPASERRLSSPPSRAFVLSPRLYCFRSYLGFILGPHGLDGIPSRLYCLV